MHHAWIMEGFQTLRPRVFTFRKGKNQNSSEKEKKTQNNVKTRVITHRIAEIRTLYRNRQVVT